MQMIIFVTVLIKMVNSGRFSRLLGKITFSAMWHRRALFSPELWNVCALLEGGLGRTNNSVEGWHSYWNNEIREHPRLSQLAKRIQHEDNRWKDMITEFQHSPANGVRGKGVNRRSTYVEQDLNLYTLYMQRNNNNQTKIGYLRAIAHHL
jgi:hypothetical protein